MNGHININDLASYAAGMTGKRKSMLILKHITECESCSKKHDSVMSILRQPDIAGINPPGRVKIRLIESYRGMKKDPDGFAETASSFINKWKYAIALPTAALAIFGLYYIFKLTGPCVPVYLDIAFLKGGVSIDEKKASESDRINELSKLKLENDAAAEIVYAPLSLKIAGEGGITIIRAVKMDEKTELIFEMKGGRLLSSSDNTRSNISYKYTTKHAVIIPLGTEFFIDAGLEKTVIILRNGRLKISSRTSGNSITADAGKKYTVTTLIETENITASDIETLDKLCREIG
jgi:hypothetical protein